MSIQSILKEVIAELESSTLKHGNFNSPHEGYAVLLEEVEEMWYEIKHGTPERARAEAIQVAAMAIKLIDGYPEPE